MKNTRGNEMHEMHRRKSRASLDSPLLSTLTLSNFFLMFSVLENFNSPTNYHRSKLTDKFL